MRSVPYLFSLCLLACCFTNNSLIAQITPAGVQRDSVVFENETDSIITEGKTLDDAKLIKSKAKEYVPRKAGLYSAILPGMGQAYNKKYWKIPIIYGGFVALGLTIDFYNDRYNTFRNELFNDIINNQQSVSASGFNESQLRSIIDNARRERDFFIILSGVLYLLNIADAHIDAHLKEFDLNEELKLSIDPKVSSGYYGSMNAGISLKLRF